MNVSRLVQDTNGHEQEVDQFAADVLTGFSSKPKYLSAKYFYDDIGSELFSAISQHEDYYLTRTEYGILDANSKYLPGRLDESEVDIIELGAGDGHKSQLVINAFLNAGVTIDFYPITFRKRPYRLTVASKQTGRRSETLNQRVRYRTDLARHLIDTR